MLAVLGVVRVSRAAHATRVEGLYIGYQWREESSAAYENDEQVGDVVWNFKRASRVLFLLMLISCSINLITARRAALMLAE